MGDPNPTYQNSDSVIAANHQLLASVIGSYDEAQAVTVHHYTKSFRGFSAMLTPQQAQQLSKEDSVVSVLESKMNKIHTTHSWDFLGINGIKQQPQMDIASNVIVGIIDTGVWPESRSFNDAGLGPVPKTFKGECVTGQNFTLVNCNRKIIGARFYSKGFEAENGPLESFNKIFFRSPRDGDGHGTHTASTAAGAIVADISYSGMARGTARGGAPSARLAIYKACWFNLCSDADLFSAFDDAINDGVDILSLSLGPDPPQPDYFSDTVSIGTFHAFRKGIFVSASAGNNFFTGTVTNAAPWIFTVAASTIDREFNSNVYLGNSDVLKGFSINPLKMDSFYGLINGEDAPAPGVSSANASFCKNNTLDPTLIKGKIVVCTIEAITDNRRAKATFVKQGGGVGMILIDPNVKGVGFQFEISGTIILQAAADQLLTYMSAEKNPVARIAPTTTVLYTKPAPIMAGFSSRGPNAVNPDILKPDVTAPGVNILAAWSPVATDTTGGRSTDYNIISGTSMSCPHITGVAAVIKSYHPYWSPAAIKSAIMTTATVIDNTQNPITRDPSGALAMPFDYGAGHININASLNPGLIYDFDANDVIDFLCSNGATPAQLNNLTGQLMSCKPSTTPSYNFNYPSIGVSNMKGNLTVYRTVTYYGVGPTVYHLQINPPEGVEVMVTPQKLVFIKSGEKTTYKIDFMPSKTSSGSFVFGSLTWRNGVHSVRSPIGLNVLSVQA